MKGGIIVYPTDTVYGLGADATNKRAVNKIYSLKKRPKSLPLSVLVSDFSMLKKYAKTTKGFKRGKYTFVLKPKKQLPVSKGSIGFRIPKHWCTNLAKEFGKPIVTTSANIHGQPVAQTITEAKRIFGKKVNLYIDGGKLGTKPSKIIFLNRKTHR